MSREAKNVAGAALIAFAVVCFCDATPNFAQYIVSPLGPNLISEMGIDVAQLQSLFSAPLIPAIFLSLIAGTLIDKLGCKLVIGTGFAIAAAGCIWRIFVGDFSLLMIATMLTGFGATFLNAGCGKLLAGYFGAKNVNSKMGVLVAFPTIGMTLAMASGARIGNVKIAFIVSAVLSSVAAILWALLVREPEQGDAEELVQTAEKPALSACLKAALTSPGVWLTSLAMFAMMAANVVVSSTMPTALSSRGIDPVAAGDLTTFITIGNFIGCFAAPIVAKLLGSHRRAIVILAAIAAVGIAFAWRIPNYALTAAAFLIAGTCHGGIVPLLLAVPVQLEGIGEEYAGTAGGVVSTLQLLGGVLLPSFVITPIAGSDFGLMFMLAGVCLAVSSVSSAFLKIK